MIFQGDARIRTAIELGLEDIAKNQWLIDDILGDFISNEYLRARYASQIDSCKQWLANNRINIYMSERDDKMDFPCVVIKVGANNEKSEMKTMGDISTGTADFIPNKINRPLPYVISPGAGSYDSASGLFNFASAANLTLVAPGMVLVDPATGTGFKILSVDGNGISVGPNMTLSAAKYGVVPQYQIYQAKIGHTFLAESYDIECSAMDQQTTIWLHSIVLYCLLRYRQALLEADGFAESMIKNTQLYLNQDYGNEGASIWSRSINLTGQTEPTWIMAPHRFVETVNFKDPDRPEGYFGGIKIVSNLNDTEDLSGVNWATIADSLEE